ncbi:PIN domain-containing protein [Bacillus cereus]|uniref:DUF4935 domain-containing protein n=1 Tax=Bacillus cereus (strain VD014) TaxID=1053223 RepID=A0A9W5K2A4_BACC8|nr:PIN domain-containing protein [Bacillus cereus]EJR12428.1 hypothetical protein IIA_05621 [Bacillus cereus VD014]
MTNIFIDTQVFVHRNFNYKNDLFQRLIHAAQDGLITIYLTDIVIKEIESKIHEHVYEKTKNSLPKFVKDSKVLKNIEDYSTLFDIEKRLDNIYEELIRQFNQFLNDANVGVISVDDVSPAYIFEMYFNGIPPFSRKKRDEFPDAFSLVALETWFEQQEEKISIISDDKDLKNFCEESQILIYEPSLESFFDSLTKNKTYKHDFIVSVYDSNLNEIGSSVVSDLEEHWFMLIGEDGEVEKVKMLSIDLDEDPYILEIEEDEEQSATLAFNASVHLEANISYIDYSSSYYDKEEGKYFYTEYVDRVIDDVVEVPVLIKIKFEHYNKEEMDIMSISLNEGEPIQISLHEEY